MMTNNAGLVGFRAWQTWSYFAPWRCQLAKQHVANMLHQQMVAFLIPPPSAKRSYAPGIQRWTSSQRWISEVNWELCEYVKGWSAWVGRSARDNNFHHHNQKKHVAKTLFLFVGGEPFFSFESFVKLMKKCHVRSYLTVKSKSANPKNSKGEVSSLPSKKKLKG